MGIDQLKSLYGPGGVHEDTLFFHGKKKQIQDIINVVVANEFFLDPDIVDELLDYIREQAFVSVKIALQFEDIVNYRMRDIDELFESFFDQRGIGDDPAVLSFIEHVKLDLLKYWEGEFQEVDEPKPSPAIHPPVLPPSVQVQQQVVKSMPMDLMDAIREAKDLLPNGVDASNVASELLGLFLGKSGWAKTASIQEPEPLSHANLAMEEFLSKQSNRQEWELFAKHVMTTLYSKWMPSNSSQIGTLQSPSHGKMAIPLLRSPTIQKQTTPVAQEKVPDHDVQNIDISTATVPAPFQVKHKHYGEDDF